MTMREQFIELGQLPLTEEGYLAVIRWLGRASKADLERIAGGRSGNRQALVDVIVSTLRTPRASGPEAAGFGGLERAVYDRGRMLVRLGKSESGERRAFLIGAPEGMGLYVKDAQHVLENDPTVEA